MRGPSHGSFGSRFTGHWVSITHPLVALLAPTLALIAVLLLAMPVTASAQPPAKSGELIVKFRAGADPSVIDAIKADLGATRIRAFDRIRAEHDRISVGTVEEAIGRYRNHPDVEIIEPNYIVTEAVTPNDPLFPQLWGLNNTGQTGGVAGADISATDAWAVATSASTVIVAIIDTGVDYGHPDLAANIYANPGEVAGNGLDDDGNGFVDDVRGWDFVNGDNDPFDDRGHGTHVAGTIGAVGNNALGVAGVAWSVRLMPLKFLSAGGSGTTADAISAIEYATAMGAHVMNNSWGGGGYSLALQQAIEDASAAGILFVAAAGNAANNNDAFPFYPANYDVPNLVSVAATTDFDQLAVFSNYGATTVDLGAPGEEILSTLPGAQYGLNSGTSMAAPHVTGILALMKARFPLAPMTALKTRLLATVDVLPALTGWVASNGRANALLALADPDEIVPGAPEGLEIVESTSNTIRLRWIASGDDGSAGTAAAYEVRYATAPITENSFPAATLAGGAPQPQPSGSVEEMEVAGLDVSTNYYIALRALDEMGNPSLISNVVSGTTLGAPSIAVTPSSIAENLLTGASADRALAIQNVGEGTLDFTVSGNLVSGASEAQEFLALERGEPDPRVGDPVEAGAGGPDAFGYRWVDSDQPGGPVFDWVEISGIGTQLPLQQLDENYGPIPIGFSFPFYGTQFTTVRACTHGWLSFTNSSTQYTNQPLPNAGAPENLLAVFWDDLNFSGVRRAYYHNDGSRFIVQYQAVPKTGGGGPFTFQTILYPNGRIVYQYLSMGSPSNAATIGMQNAARNDGLTVAFNTNYVRDGLAIELRRVPQWFQVSPTSGRVVAGAGASLNVAIDATDLPGGLYQGQVRIASNDPTAPETVVPVDLTVVGVADIDLSRTSIEFGSVFVGGSRTDTLEIWNRGTNPLQVTEIAASPPDFEVAPASLSLPIGARDRVIVTFRPGSATSISGALAVRSDDPDEPELNVALHGVGLVPPDIAVTPPSLAADLLTGQAETQALTVANEGGSDLTFGVSVTNVVFPPANPAASLPSRSTEEILAGYAAHAADPSAAPPETAAPGVQPGIVPYWERLREGLTEGAVIFHDDMEGGLNGWTHAATAGGVDLWAQTTARSHSGTTSWRVQQHDVAGADALRSPAIDLTFRRDAVLAFQHWHRFDDCGGDPTFEPDGGVVEISTNGGATWTQITPTGGYPYVLDDICGNPLAFRQAYSHGGGIGAEFIPAVFDLTPFVGGEIVLRFHAGWDCGNCQTNEGWYIDDVTLYSSGPPILAVTPESGSVPAGSSLDLSARFDATGLFGGDYTMDVVVGSNDPDEGHVVVPASLHVTGVADIEVTPAAIGFGTAFLGVGATDTLLVYNAGTDLLHVTGVSSDHAAFSAPAAPFDLAPGTVRELLVAFAPDAVGPFAAALTIASDDPDEAIVTVPLTGEGVIAPDIGIEPPALVVDLFTGDTAERTLTISNSGGSDLVVEISAKRPAAPLGLGFTPNPDPPPAASSLESRDDTTVEPSGAPGGANGPTPSILVIQNTSAWGVSMAEFIQANFGITATVIGSSQIASTDFAPYDLIVTVGDESSTYYGALSANVAKFEAYANAGGVIQYQLATQGNNVVLPRGAQALYGNIEYQNRVLLPNHPIVAGLPTTLNGSAANHNYLTSLPAGSQVITETYNSHQPTTVEYPVGDGMVVATGMTWEFLYFYNYDAGPMLYQATEYSLTKGLPRWISIAPPGATVPAGGSAEFLVGFDAAGLLGGRYDALVRVASNDPDEAAVDVPATMNVTGIPIIEVSPSSLDFGSLFVGLTASRTILVRNTGTDALVVSGIGFDDASYSAAPAAFAVAIGDTQSVTVTFAPASPGDKAATLSIAHNAAGSPTAITLSGVGLDPPDVGIDPASLTVDLFTGDTAERTLTISNSGGSDLVVGVSAERQPVPLGLGFTPSANTPSEASSQDPHENTVIAPAEGAPGGAAGPTPAILVIQDWAAWGLNMAQFIQANFGITATVINSSQIAAANFTPYDLIVTMGDQPFAYYSALSLNVAKFEAYANAGGVIQYQLATQGSNVALPRGAQATYGNPEFQNRVLLPEHPIVEGLPTTLHGNFANHNYLTSLPAGVQVITETFNLHQPTTVEYPVGRGMVVATGMTWEWLYLNNYDAGPMLYKATEYSLSKGRPDWLSVSPSSATIPAGGSAEFLVGFDAAGLLGGRYDGLVRVASNDPDEAIVDVPATMNVTGIPIIEVSPSSLAYDTLFVGASRIRVLTIRNRGTETLALSGLSIDDDSYHAVFAPVSIPPGDSVAVQITFAPTTAGDKSATLSIVHNAPGSPTSVPLRGIALDPPIVTLSPDAIDAVVEAGTLGHETLTVGNLGGSDLRFLVRPEGAGAVPVSLEEPPGKGEADPRVGDVVTLGAGGPDQFGYRWMDSDEEGGPAFQWVDIRPTGTPIPISGDDATSQPVPIGFSFPFYGQEYSTVRVCTNGWLSFTSPSASYSNTPLPSSFAPPNLLAAFWDDLLFDAGSSAHYRYDGTRFIVQFTAVRHLSGAGLYTFEVILYPSGAVLFQYLSMAQTLNGCTVGIQNATFNDGLTVVFNQNYVHDGLAIRFSAAPAWLSLDPTEGVVPAGGSLPVDVRLDAQDLFPGSYEGAIRLTSNDPVTPTRIVPVSVQAIGIPHISTFPAALRFDTLYVGQSKTLPLVVTNVGTAALAMTHVTAGRPDFTATPMGFTLQPLQSATIQVTFTAGPTGTRDSHLLLTSNDPHSPTFVPLYAATLVPPVAAVTPGSVEAVAMPGASASRTIVVANTGGSDLRFRIDTEDASRTPVAQGSYLPLAKEEPDPRVGESGVGGPDLYGHYWVDSDDPGGPAFQWTDITAIGTKVAFGAFSDDQTLGPFPIGFSFPFYGQDFFEFRVCTNGFISFTSLSNAFANQPLPNAGTGVPENLLAAFWDDLIHRADLGSSVYYYSDGAKLVVQFNNMQTFAPPAATQPTFQIVLKPNGEVIYQYLSVGNLATGVTVGMQNGTRDDGLNVAFNVAYPRDGMAVKITEVTPWISASPAIGVVRAGESLPVSLVLDASELEEGDYTATLRTHSNDPVHPDIATDVLFHVNVAEAAAAAFDPNTLNLDSNGQFTNVYVELPAWLDPERVVLGSVRFRDEIAPEQDRLMIGDFNQNGVPDLQFRLTRILVEANLPEGDAVPVWLTGEIENTNCFAAHGSVRVIRPNVTAPNGSELVLSGAPYVVRWTNPSGWRVDAASVYYSLDLGESWALVAENVVGESVVWNVPDVRSTQALIRVYLFDQRGVMGYDSSDQVFGIVETITGVEVTEIDASLPKEHALHQNSPNPFNPVTTIRLDLPRAADVRLDVFTVDGRLVRTLARAPMAAGRRSVTWDGRDDDGRAVGSGVYLYRVKAGPYEASKRMILIK